MKKIIYLIMLVALVVSCSENPLDPEPTVETEGDTVTVSGIVFSEGNLVVSPDTYHYTNTVCCFINSITVNYTVSSSLTVMLDDVVHTGNQITVDPLNEGETNFTLAVTDGEITNTYYITIIKEPILDDVELHGVWVRECAPEVPATDISSIEYAFSNNVMTFTMYTNHTNDIYVVQSNLYSVDTTQEPHTLHIFTKSYTGPGIYVMPLSMMLLGVDTTDVIYDAVYCTSNYGSYSELWIDDEAICSLGTQVADPYDECGWLICIVKSNN